MAIQHQAFRKRENFPVASRLIPRKARRTVLAFYDFARGADTIADHPTMDAADKEAALTKLRDAIAQHFKNQMPPWAEAYYTAIYSGQLNPIHGEQLLEAFIQDTRKKRYQTVDELLDYCRLSAVPVGRAVLDACREQAADLESSDAICVVLQLINHLQDLKEDYTTLDRIYLPQEWMSECGAVETDLAQVYSTVSLRAVINQLLDYCDVQVSVMNRLPRTLHSFRLRLEIAVIIALAQRLLKRLRQSDPLVRKIHLSMSDKLLALLRAISMVIR